MVFKQAVTSEDMYLQMSGRNPSSTSCEDLVVRNKNSFSENVISRFFYVPKGTLYEIQRKTGLITSQLYNKSEM